MRRCRRMRNMLTRTGTFTGTGKSGGGSRAPGRVSTPIRVKARVLARTDFNFQVVVGLGVEEVVVVRVMHEVMVMVVLAWQW